MQPDLNAMAVFASVVENGGFTAASRALSIPKSTISRKVAQLESDLGVRLLERTTRRLRVTDAGTQYYDYCHRVAREAEQAARAMTRLQDTPQGVLRITTDPAIGMTVLPPILAEYLETHPEVHVQLTLSSERLDLIREGLHLGIWTGQLPDSTLKARLLARERQTLCASPRYVERRDRLARPTDLARHDVLAFGARAGEVSWTLVDERGSVETPRLTARVTASDLRVLHQAALAGLGIARLPGYLVADDLREARLVPVLPGWRSDPLPAYVVYPSSEGQPAKVQAFVDLVRARFPEGVPDPASTPPPARVRAAAAVAAEQPMEG